MGDVIWSPSALEDIEQIAQFIARDSSDQAAIFVDRLMESRIAWHQRLSPVGSFVKPVIPIAGKSSTGPIASLTGTWAGMSGSPVLFTELGIGSPSPDAWATKKPYGLD